MKRSFEALATLITGLALIACFLVPVKKPLELPQVFWGEDIQYNPLAGDSPELVALKAAREAQVQNR